MALHAHHPLPASQPASHSVPAAVIGRSSKLQWSAGLRQRSIACDSCVKGLVAADLLDWQVSHPPPQTWLSHDESMQAAKVQQLSKRLEGCAAEIQAQQLALNAIAAERDAGRSIVAEASERAQVCLITLLWYSSNSLSASALDVPLLLE